MIRSNGSAPKDPVQSAQRREQASPENKKKVALCRLEQDDQAAKVEAPRRELLADSGSEPGANAGLLFKEPAARMTQHDGWASSRVGWTIPATHAKTN
jgi:hypothetical protein